MAEYRSPVDHIPVVAAGDQVDEHLASPSEPHGRGYVPRPWGDEGWGWGQAGGRSVYDEMNVLRGNDLRDAIEQMDKDEDSLEVQMRDMGWQVKNQGQTNYCWMFGTTTAAMLERLTMGAPVVQLSATSAAAVATGFQNRGGWGDWACKACTRDSEPGGWATVETWPETRISRSQYTSEAKAEMSEHSILGWWEVQPRDVEAICTLLLNRKAVAVGFNWWRHLVCAVRPIWDGGPGYVIVNSWGEGWGDRGYGKIVGEKARAEGIVAVHSMMPYGRTS